MCACSDCVFGCCFFLFSIVFFVDCCVYVARGLFLLQNNYNISGFFSVHYWKPGKMYEFSLKLKWKTIYAFREIFMCSWIGFYANICGQVYSSIGYCLNGITHRVRIFFFLQKIQIMQTKQRQRIIKKNRFKSIG